ncbi:MAG TPA: hypothetical protein ACFYD3_00330 [Candidatus Hypogeohydataceae bacterium YC41]
MGNTVGVRLPLLAPKRVKLMDELDNLEDRSDKLERQMKNLEEKAKTLRLKLAFLKERFEARKERMETILIDVKWMTIVLWVILLLIIISAYLVEN